MTDTDKLKRLKKEIKRKEFWRETRDSRDYVVDEICEADDYGAEERHAYPEWLRGAILALIAENEAQEAKLKVVTEALESVNVDASALCRSTIDAPEAVYEIGLTAAQALARIDAAE